MADGASECSRTPGDRSSRCDDAARLGFRVHRMQHCGVPHDPAGGPLDGVRVLELGNFIAGPFAGQLLGDYGADVIKIEAPDGGDPMRHWGITHEGQGLWWPAIARNKRSVVADLRTAAGRELVQSIAYS